MKTDMAIRHAVLWVDHHQASLHPTGVQSAPAQRLKAHRHATAQHGSEVRSEHEFFAEICEALGTVEAALVTGSKMALADFKHYVEKHRPQIGKRIASYQAVDHPTGHQLVALGRAFFERR